MLTRNRSSVLLIDDDHDMRWAMRSILVDAGFDVMEAQAGEPGLELASRHPPDAVVLDMRMSGIGGEEVLRRLLQRDRRLPIVIATAYGTITGAINAIKEGAFEYLTKPFRNDQFVDVVKRAVARRAAIHKQSAENVRADIFGLMGKSAAIQKLADEIEAVARSDYSVVVQGETGSGKEIVAQSLHRHSGRVAKPFIIVDCGAIAESLINSEFFGHEKGAFTGAAARHCGCFEAAAKGGTIFLDEIGNLSIAGQKALLRALEARTIHRVGGSEQISLDVRVIAATNDALKERAEAGDFREDLYYRLAEYVISVPPLRARPEDVPFLAERFLVQARDCLGQAPIDIDAKALELLQAHHWPGNVRELRNVMRRAALTSADAVSPAHIADRLNRAPLPPSQTQMAAAAAPLRDQMRCQVRAVERDAVLDALNRAKGNKAEAARLLGVDYKTYRLKLKRLEGEGGDIRQ
ncbi:sigma-54 dependent transcriptional regulator [Methylocystis sp. JR02]|uniref:sigma-54-dependent transcriptional regulator n=1 Tax=Methylocystis sp. JR02 TaxID=3046284 RepID=UPI0024BB0E27|nr:sigma-54 dependent transcriptional regulator [Methylocystis sp. JR02]MDJ0447533.1 sigma-54 dependent transcriptional regulator [Methylocystis sp. JR02]